jgi:prophage regulatory protein
VTENILRLPQVKAHTGLGKTQIYGLIREKKFPAPVHLTKRARGWLLSEIEAWIATRKEARNSGRPAR